VLSGMLRPPFENSPGPLPKQRDAIAEVQVSDAEWQSDCRDLASSTRKISI
jgi:hypothetical protein